MAFAWEFAVKVFCWTNLAMVLMLITGSAHLHQGDAGELSFAGSPLALAQADICKTKYKRLKIGSSIRCIA